MASVLVVEDNSGCSLNELIEELRSNSDYCNNLQFEISLQKELKRVSQDEASNKKFSLKSIHYFLNQSINPFETIPENVDKLEYCIDLSDSSHMSSKDFESYIKP